MKDIRDGPLAWAVCAGEVALGEREALQRLVSGSFELSNNLRINSSRLTGCAYAAAPNKNDHKWNSTTDPMCRQGQAHVRQNGIGAGGVEPAALPGPG